MESFGSYLKGQREKKGIRLEEIASITKIHLHSLQLLEASRWKDLPPEPFIRGFIIAYAKYIGLELKETLAKYQEEVGVKPAPVTVATPPDSEAHSAPAPTPTEPSAHTPIPPNPADMIEKSPAINSKTIFIGAGAFAALVLMIVIITVGKNSSNSGETSAQNNEPAAVSTEASKAAETKPENTEAPKKDKERLVASPEKTEKPAPEKTAAEKAVVAATAAATPNATPANAAPATTEANAAATPIPDGEVKHEMVIEGKERTWIKIVVDNDAPIEYFLPEGQKASYKAREKIKVVLGNAAGSKVFHNGTEVPGSLYQGTIRFYIFPRGSRFPQDASSKRTPSSTVLGTDAG